MTEHPWITIPDREQTESFSEAMTRYIEAAVAKGHKLSIESSNEVMEMQPDGTMITVYYEENGKVIIDRRRTDTA